MFRTKNGFKPYDDNIVTHLFVIKHDYDYWNQPTSWLLFLRRSAIRRNVPVAFLGTTNESDFHLDIGARIITASFEYSFYLFGNIQT